MELEQVGKDAKTGNEVFKGSDGKHYIENPQLPKLKGGLPLLSYHEVDFDNAFKKFVSAIGEMSDAYEHASDEEQIEMDRLLAMAEIPMSLDEWYLTLIGSSDRHANPPGSKTILAYREDWGDRSLSFDRADIATARDFVQALGGATGKATLEEDGIEFVSIPVKGGKVCINENGDGVTFIEKGGK